MSFIDYKGVRYSYREPGYCPHCHRNISPIELWHQVYFNNLIESDHLMSVWKCPAKECLNIIVVEYDFSIFEENKHALGSSKLISPQKFLNGSVKFENWPKFIKELMSGFSLEPMPSRFESIYNQALETENNGLNEIAGMGFRKALEHLVKDVAVLNLGENPIEKDIQKIKNLQLSQVINEYFNNELKELLQKAAWLGNDQSHYFKLYEEFDIPELKEIIGLIVSDIDREFRKKRFLEIESRKRKID